jgi:hypothetical protein
MEWSFYKRQMGPEFRGLILFGCEGQMGGSGKSPELPPDAPIPSRPTDQSISRPTPSRPTNKSRAPLSRPLMRHPLLYQHARRDANFRKC